MVLFSLHVLKTIDLEEEGRSYCSSFYIQAFLFSLALNLQSSDDISQYSSLLQSSPHYIGPCYPPQTHPMGFLEILVPESLPSPRHQCCYNSYLICPCHCLSNCLDSQCLAFFSSNDLDLQSPSVYWSIPTSYTGLGIAISNNHKLFINFRTMYAFTF